MSMSFEASAFPAVTGDLVPVAAPTDGDTFERACRLTMRGWWWKLPLVASVMAVLLPVAAVGAAAAMAVGGLVLLARSALAATRRTPAL